MKLSALLTFIGLMGLLIAACSPEPVIPPTSTPDASSRWSAPQLIASSPQADSPAFAITGGLAIAAWIGADDAGVHQDARVLNTDLQAILPLPPRHPYAQTVYSTSSRGAHLLWLDAADDSSDDNSLYSALITPRLTIERGPTPISQQITLRYAAIERADGGLWTAWVGGVDGSLTTTLLTLTPIDPAGRPRPGQLAAQNVDHPAFVRTADGLWLMWLDRESGALVGAPLDETGDGIIGDAQTLTSGLFLNTGDRIDSVAAAAAGNVITVLLNVTRGDQSAEVWTIYGRGSVWSAPSQVTHDGQPLERTSIASDGSSVGVAGLLNGNLVFARLERGELQEVELIVGGVNILRPSTLRFADGRWWVGWSQAQTDAPASLLISTRQS